MEFNVKMDLFDFERMVGFWSGAKTNWDSYNEEQKEYLNQYACEMMEFGSLTQVNDLIWFDGDDILKEANLFESDDEE